MRHFVNDAIDAIDVYRIAVDRFIVGYNILPVAFEASCKINYNAIDVDRIDGDRIESNRIESNRLELMAPDANLFVFLNLIPALNFFEIPAQITFFRLSPSFQVTIRFSVI